MIAIVHSIYSQSVHALALNVGLMDNDAYTLIFLTLTWVSHCAGRKGVDICMGMGSHVVTGCITTPGPVVGWLCLGCTGVLRTGAT